MRTRTVLSTAIAAGLIATALVATPALAAGGSGGAGAGGSGSGQSAGCTDGAGTGTGAGTGMGSVTGAAGLHDGSGRADNSSGPGRGAGNGPGSTLAPESGTVTDAQEATLAAMAEEEKLAQDLYLAFADSYDVRVFTRVATAETRHLEALQSLLVNYGIDDPTTGQAVGEFNTSAAQELYDELLAQGATSLDAAYEAARTVESTDITDLRAATDGVTAPDVLAVYDHLLAGSEKHLVAFGG